MTNNGTLLDQVAKSKMDSDITSKKTNLPFKLEFEKFSNFSSDTTQIDAPDFDFGQLVKFTIPKSCDLITDMYLQFDLPELIPVNNLDQSNLGMFDENSYLSWVDSVGNALIENVKLKIGEQVIDEQSGEYLNIWNQFYLEKEKKKIYHSMVGKNDFITNDSKNAGTYIIPLNFWFCNNNNFLPIIALQYHSVTLEVKLRQFNQLWKSQNVELNRNIKYSISNAVLYTENIYLNRKERNDFAQQSYSLLIKQIQYRTFTIPESIPDIKLNLDFNHPIIELFWVYQNNNSKKAIFNYFKDPNDNPTEPIKKCQLKYNGLDRTQELNSEFFRLIEPYKKHTSIPDDYIYNYSFSRNPEAKTPVGSSNFSRIETPELLVTFDKNIPEGTVKVYAVNLNILEISGGMARLKYSN